MAKRVLLIVVIVIVAGFLYFGYTNYDAGRSATNGDVYSNDQPSGRHRNSDVSSEDSRDTKSASQPIVYPTPNQTPAPVVPNDQTTQPGTPGGGNRQQASPPPTPRARTLRTECASPAPASICSIARATLHTGSTPILDLAASSTRPTSSGRNPGCTTMAAAGDNSQAQLRAMCKASSISFSTRLSRASGLR